MSAVALLMAGVATGAAAETGADAPRTLAGLADTVQIELTGSISERCLLSGGHAIDFGHLRGGEEATTSFVIDCNMPFDIDIISTRGGLAHATLPMGEGPFDGTLEYDLRLTVPTLRPTPATVQASFGSRQLLAKRTLSSGDGIAAGGGTLEFRMRRPEGAGLLAGRYTETLRLLVTPRM